MPDVKGTITNSFATGNTVTLEVTWNGTHTGQMETPDGTLPPSGKSQTTPSAWIMQFVGRQDHGEPPLLRHGDPPHADRRDAAVAADHRQGVCPPRACGLLSLVGANTRVRPYEGRHTGLPLRPRAPKARRAQSKVKTPRATSPLPNASNASLTPSRGKLRVTSSSSFSFPAL